MMSPMHSSCKLDAPGHNCSPQEPKKDENHDFLVNKVGAQSAQLQPARAKKAQGSGQEAARSTQEAPRDTQEASRSSQETPRKLPETSQKGPRTHPEPPRDPGKVLD